VLARTAALPSTRKPKTAQPWLHVSTQKFCHKGLKLVTLLRIDNYSPCAAQLLFFDLLRSAALMLCNYF
jgi:hypothetical protein